MLSKYSVSMGNSGHGALRAGSYVSLYMMASTSFRNLYSAYDVVKRPPWAAS